jgi:ubiquitin-like 1-activating enzyme E1 B
MNYHIRQTDLIHPDKLRDVSIAIVGAGGIGSWTSLGLLKLGCGNVTIIDNDTIEEHNIGSQFYTGFEIGQSKAVALSEKLPHFSGLEVKAITESVTPQHLQGKQIVVSAVDSMEVRKQIFNSLQKTKTMFIDGRMSGNAINIFCTDMQDRKCVDKYAKTLFSDEEAEPEACTARAVVYNTFVIAGLITDMVACFVNNKRLPRELIIDLANYAMYGGFL